MITLLRRSLERSVKTSAELRSADVASLVRSGRLPASIPELANEHDDRRGHATRLSE